MSEFDRDFKGVWIPREVWLDTRLNALDKIILIEIDSLDSGERGCYASNKYIAEFCQCSESKVTKAISKLIELGYIYLQKFDGRQRELRSCLSNYDKQSSKNYEADYQKNLQIKIYNNIGNNIVTTTTAADGEAEEEPEEENENELKLIGGKLGKGVVMMTDAQFEHICTILSKDEIDAYVERMANFIISCKKRTGSPPNISHYREILKWVEEDRKL